MRLFFALWPPRETAEALAGWARSLGGRPVPAGSLHLTLAFLGNADADKAIMTARRVTGERHDLPVERAGYWRHNSIVWAGPRETPPELFQLVESLNGALRQENFALEDRPFAAHVTLVRKARAPSSLAGLPEVRWPVEEFALVASTPGREGSRYRTLEAFQLR